MIDYILPRRLSASAPARSVLSQFWYEAITAFSPTASRETVTQDTALTYSAVWAATRLLCGTIASLPLPVYRRTIEGGSEGREKATAHPLNRVLGFSPNSEMTAYNFRSVMTAWMVNSGNAWAEIIRDDAGDVAGLVPIHPMRMRLDDSDPSYRRYWVTQEDGTEREYQRRDLFHLTSVVTKDGRDGMGVIQQARESIGFGLATEKYGAAWFGSGGVPRAVVEHPAKWDDTQRAAFRRDWRKMYSGAEGDKIALLTGGGVLKEIGISQEDSQFLQTRQHNIEEIARWYAVPPHMLQHLLRATFDNIEHLGIEFVQYSLVPWLRQWEQAIAWQLLPVDEQETHFVEHNVTALLRGDAQTRAEFYSRMVSGGIMTRNEARKLENLDAVDGGDTFLVQGAMVALSEDGEPESEFSGNAGGSGGFGEPAGDESEEDVQAVKSALAKTLGALARKQATAARRAARKPREFLAWADEYFPKQVGMCDDALSLAVASGVFDDPAGWCERGREMLIEVAGECTADGLYEAVDRVVSSEDWTWRPKQN